MHGDLDKTSSRLYAMRTMLTGGDVARALGATTEDLTELIIQSHPQNTDIIDVGTFELRAWVLEPGDTFNVPIRNPALLWATTPSGIQHVNLIGRKGP